MSAENLGKTYADQAWDMYDRLTQDKAVDGDSYGRAIALFKKAAGKGNKKVFNIIGYIYQYHQQEMLVEGTLKYNYDCKRYSALIEGYYNKAISNGEYIAIYNLATCYDRSNSSLGFEMNLDKAVSLYRMGAGLGNAYCLNALGDLYREGTIKATDKYNSQAAFEMYLKAYQNQKDNCPSIFNLAQCYDKGEGVKRDEAKAIALYKEGSSYDADCIVALAVCYEEGRGVEKDLRKAYDLYNKALDDYFYTVDWVMERQHHVGYLLGLEDTPYSNEEQTISAKIRDKNPK